MGLSIIIIIPFKSKIILFCKIECFLYPIFIEKLPIYMYFHLVVALWLYLHIQ